MSLKRYLIFSALLFGLCTIGIAQNSQRTAETTARVPELNAFHEVIYQIWHEAWPKKDTALLQRLLPDVETGISKVAAAQLPGILRDKKPLWEEGVRKLQAAGVDYKQAVSSKNDAEMLKAAEILHSRFEALMRAIRPALKELDDFHAVPYMLYHYYLPDFNLDKIRSSATELKQKMEPLNNARLPDSLKDRDHEFQVARDMLSKSVGALESTVRSNDKKAIQDAVEAVHSNYQAVEKIF